MSTIPLRRLQRWFAWCVEHPATADVAIASREGEALVRATAVAAGSVIAPNPHRSAAEMLQVYNGGYLERLTEVMQSDFGCVQHVIGETAFRALVARYVHAHPSRHPNLNQLGRHFPAFVRTAPGLRHRAFLAELATLERAVCTSFDAPEFAPLPLDAFAQIPAERHARARFTVNPSLQLLTFRYPVDEFLQAWKDDAPLPVPRARASWLAVFRRDGSVWRQRLSSSQHRVLAALVARKPLAAALAHAKKAEPVAQWFGGFQRDGLFTHVRA